MNNQQCIDVMIVDDSAVVRQVVSNILSKDKSINVYAAVADPIFAMKRMQMKWPDVVVLDVEMPRMDGVTFLRQIMQQRPTPVVICSSLTEKGAEVTMHALEAGAVSIITKPKLGLKEFLIDSSNDLVNAVKVAAKARLSNIVARPSPIAVQNSIPTQNPAVGLSGNETSKHETAAQSFSKTTDKVVAIGTSTGGTQALEAILTSLPPDCPGIVIVQHMPEKFTSMFAQRLDSMCQIKVKEASHGDFVKQGLAIIAPGGKHLKVKRSGGHYCVEVFDGPLVNRHKPSVDVLFKSVAEQVGANAAGFILTGMGDDGARGLAEMRNAGAYTVAQDENSCVVFGMPKEAIKRNGAEKVLSLDKISAEILYFGLH